MEALVNHSAVMMGAAGAGVVFGLVALVVAWRAVSRVVRAVRAMEPIRAWSLTANLVLGVVGAWGAVLSYDNLRQYADRFVDHGLAYGFPLLVDALVFGASVMFVLSVRRDNPQFGWRATAHGGIAGTVFLNAMAAFQPGGGGWSGLPVHVTPPLVWAVLVELYAKQAGAEVRRERQAPMDRIPARLWLSAPVESARVAVVMTRYAIRSHIEARRIYYLHAAATDALRQAVPGWGAGAWRTRRMIRRQLRGPLSPERVLDVCTETGARLGTGTAAKARQAMVRVVLAEPAMPSAAALPAAPPAPPVPSRGLVIPPASPRRPRRSVAKANGAGEELRDAPDGELLPTVREVMAAGGGRPAVLRAVREAGFKCGTDRATRLMETVAAEQDGPRLAVVSEQ